MKHFNLFLYFTLCLSFLNAQNGFIRGTVLDESNGETLIGVSVVLQGTTNGAMTDLDGQFSITAQPGTYNVQVSYISYQTIVIEDVVVSAGQTNKLSTIVLK